VVAMFSVLVLLVMLLLNIDGLF